MNYLGTNLDSNEVGQQELKGWLGLGGRPFPDSLYGDEINGVAFRKWELEFHCGETPFFFPEILDIKRKGRKWRKGRWWE